ncbi:MAG TPA: acyl carrier protein [Thermoleophilaceae bacterium]|nr:acyl carrier protein [Thermoleophilaceae bacterium]
MQAQPADSRWTDFRDAIASLARVDPGRVRPSMTLTGELGLDSLALTELVVLMIERYDCDPLVHVPDERWPQVTVEEIYVMCVGNAEA